MAKKITADHELVKAKILAGLSSADALDCAQRQVDHDEALAEAEAATAPKSGAKKTTKAGDE